MAKADEDQAKLALPKVEGYFPENVQGDSELLSTPNIPVAQSPLHSPQGVPTGHLLETPLDRTRRRMRWVAQVSEYWPLDSLSNLDDHQINGILDGTISTLLPKANLVGRSIQNNRDITSASSLHFITPLNSPSPVPRTGKIFLLGSGPGHPSLLTAGTASILQEADLVLSDKLVPEGVLKTIPSRECLNFRVFYNIYFRDIRHRNTDCTKIPW